MTISVFYNVIGIKLTNAEYFTFLFETSEVFRDVMKENLSQIGDVSDLKKIFKIFLKRTCASSSKDSIELSEEERSLFIYKDSKHVECALSDIFCDISVMFMTARTPVSNIELASSEHIEKLSVEESAYDLCAYTITHDLDPYEGVVVGVLISEKEIEDESNKYEYSMDVIKCTTLFVKTLINDLNEHFEGKCTVGYKFPFLDKKISFFKLQDDCECCS